MVARIITSIILVLSVSVLPWWLVLLFLVSALFYFPHFYEAVCVGVLLDSVYATAANSTMIPYLITTSTVVMILIVSQIRSRLIMY